MIDNSYNYEAIAKVKLYHDWMHTEPRNSPRSYTLEIQVSFGGKRYMVQEILGDNPLVPILERVIYMVTQNLLDSVAAAEATKGEDEKVLESMLSHVDGPMGYIDDLIRQRRRKRSRE